MRISVWNYNRTRLCKVRRTGFWCSVLFNPKIWLFSKQIIVNNNFLLIQLNIIHSHSTEKVGCFFLCKKIISKIFCCQEHFAFLTLGYQWRSITICLSRRNCGDNWILLPREDTGYGTCQDMCGCEVIKNLSCGLSAPEIKAELLFHKTCLTFTSCRGGRRDDHAPEGSVSESVVSRNTRSSERRNIPEAGRPEEPGKCKLPLARSLQLRSVRR